MRVQLLCLFLVSGICLRAEETKVQKTFEAIHHLQIRLDSSVCLIGPSPDGKVHVDVRYTYPPESYTPRFTRSGDTLELGEHFSFWRSAKGKATWRIALPSKLPLDFRSGSGNLFAQGTTLDLHSVQGSGDLNLKQVEGVLDIATGSGNCWVSECEKATLTRTSDSGDTIFRHVGGTATVHSGSGTITVTESPDLALIFTAESGDANVHGIKGSLKLRAGSGNLAVTDCAGEANLQTNSGDIELQGFTGNVDADTGSGNLRARGLDLLKQGCFATESGDPEVDLPEGEGYHLTLSSGSGNPTLRLHGRAPRGTFTFSCDLGEGSIRSCEPFDHTEERANPDDPGGKLLWEAFRRGGSDTQVIVRTGSGDAALQR